MAERKCGTCREPGHTKRTCTIEAVIVADEMEAILAEQQTTPQTAPWTGALSSGELECGHRVEEGDMVRPVHAGDDETPTLECYAYCGQDDPADPVAQSDPTCGCDPAPHKEEDGTYSHWAGCPVADAQQAAAAPAWECPTAANVTLPALPTVVQDQRSRLEKLRDHPVSHAPVVGTVITRYQVILAAEVGNPGKVADPGDVVAFFGSAHGPAEGAPPAGSVTAFFESGPGEEAPEKRKQTNQYGYLCKDPVLGDFRRFKNGNVKGITRTTTFIKAASDSTALTEWNKRNVVVGASRRPDLIAQAHGRDVAEDRDFLNELVEKLETAADAKVSADIGTLVHEYTEKIDAGVITLDGVPIAYRGHVISYQTALERGGFKVVPHLLEGTIFLAAYGGVAGTFDRVLFHVPSQTYVMGDLKTGKNMTYGWDEIEAQEWTYTTGYNVHGTYDWDTDTWVPPQYRVREDYGVVMWLPVQAPTKPYPAGWDVKANGAPQAGTCYLLRTDLQRGGRHAELCAAVREGRSNKGAPVRWKNPPVDWEALFRGVCTVEDAGRLWERARAAGVAADALGYLVSLAQDALRSIGSQLS